MPSTAERFLEMLRLIPREPRKITTTELQRRLEGSGYEVSKRTVERDLKALSGPYPLVCDSRDRAAGFGWSWKKGAVHDLPGMDSPTALTFMLARQFLEQALPRSTLGLLEPHFEQARKVLNKNTAKHLARWPEKVRILPRGQKLIAPEVKPAVLDAVYTALLKDQRITVRYRPRDRHKTTSYEVNPLGLVIRDAVIYLVSTLWDYDDLKQLALHRITKAEALAKSVRRPANFNLDTYIAEGGFAMPLGETTIRLEVLFEADCAVHLRESRLSEDQTLEDQADGRVLLKATVPDTGELRWWLLGFGAGVEVMAPAGLRAEFSEVATSLARIYR